MKHKITFFILLISCTVFSQITKLGDLSSNKFLDARIIFEDNKSDVWGYILLYEKDRTDKNVYDLEYVILDKNLNKIGSNAFSQVRASFILVNFMPKISYLQKNGDALYFSIADVTKDISVAELIQDGLPWVRKINLKDYTVSKPVWMLDHQVSIFEGNKFSYRDIDRINHLAPVDNSGFMVLDDELSDTQRLDIKVYNAKFKPYKGFYFYDLDLNKKWYYSFDQTKKTKEYSKYKLFAVNNEDIVLEREFKKKDFDAFLSSYVVISKNTGTRKFEISMDDSLNLYDVYNIQFDDKQIYCYSSFQKKGKKPTKNAFYFDKIEGYCKAVFDRETGKELSRKYFYWNDLKSHLNIDEKGEINGYGYIHFLNFKSLDNGKTLVYAEGFRAAKSSKILDAFVLEFDADMKLTQFRKIEKIKNSLKDFDAWGRTIQKYGGFDYMFSQNLGNNNFVYYYSDNESKGLLSKYNPKWVLGMVTYVDGQFDFQKLELKTKTGRINPVLAKNGYILLQEISEDDRNSEIRLEKVNY